MFQLSVHNGPLHVPFDFSDFSEFKSQSQSFQDLPTPLNIQVHILSHLQIEIFDHVEREFRDFGLLQQQQAIQEMDIASYLDQTSPTLDH